MAISTAKVESIRTKALDGLEADMATYAAGTLGLPLTAEMSAGQMASAALARTDNWTQRVELATKVIRWCQHRLNEEENEGVSQL